MWGNKLGWGISAAMVIVYVGAVYMVNLALAVSPATGVKVANPELPISPDTLVTPGTEPGNAGELYLRAIEDYRSDYFKYTQFVNDGKATFSAGRKLPAVQWILDARDKAECQLFKAKPEMVVTYQPGKEIEAIKTIGSVMSRLGLLASRDGNTAEAIKLHEAAFVMGRWMVAERVVYPQYDAGMSVLAESASALASIYRKKGDKELAGKFDEFNGARIDFIRDEIEPTRRVLTSVDPTVIKKFPGDIFAIAGENADSMWRVQAVLKLGMLKYYAGRMGDQRGAQRTLRILADTDPDKVVRLAATAARDLTVEDYRKLN